MTSGTLRSTWNTARSAAPPRSPDFPSTADAPSTLVTMLSITHGRSAGAGRASAGYRSSGSTSAMASGSSCRTASPSRSERSRSDGTDAEGARSSADEGQVAEPLGRWHPDAEGARREAPPTRGPGGRSRSVDGTRMPKAPGGRLRRPEGQACGSLLLISTGNSQVVPLLSHRPTFVGCMNNGAVARAIGMVAGVLRFCWQDDTLGGLMVRPQVASRRSARRPFPLTCSFAPQLSVSRATGRDFWSFIARYR